MAFKLDRTVFKAQTFKEEQKSKTFAHESYGERLRISFYLNSVAYGFDINNPPKMNRSVFSMRKFEKNG
jgi:hypothetical protein